MFEEQLLRHLGLEADTFEEEIKGMRRAHIVQHEANTGDLAGLPLDLEPGYKQTKDEARAVYQRNSQ